MKNERRKKKKWCEINVRGWRQGIYSIPSVRAHVFVLTSQLARGTDDILQFGIEEGGRHESPFTPPTSQTAAVVEKMEYHHHAKYDVVVWLVRHTRELLVTSY